jgi:hypothetical protein
MSHVQQMTDNCVMIAAAVWPWLAAAVLHAAISLAIGCNGGRVATAAVAEQQDESAYGRRLYRKQRRWLAYAVHALLAACCSTTLYQIYVAQLTLARRLLQA